MTRTRPGRAGHSLLETTFAGAILAVVLAGLASTLVTSFQTDTRSYHATRAQNFARAALEETRETAFRDLPKLHGTVVASNGYSGTLSVTDLSTTLRQVRIVVRHESSARSYTFLTLRADR